MSTIVWSTMLALLCGQQAPPLEVLPPLELVRPATARMAIDDHHVGFAELDTQTRSVSVQWNHFPTPQFHAGRTSESRRFPLSFPATSIAAGAIGVLYVGGTRSDGRTTIEKWTFAVPSSLPERALALERTSVVPLYDAIASGRSHVVHLAPTVGFAGVIVQHHDSRALWSWTESTGTWMQVASPIGGAPLLVPELDDVLWTSFHARSHKTLGAMYSFRSETIERVLVILDGDKNGVLDDARFLDAKGWAAAGFGDPDNYDSWP